MDSKVEEIILSEINHIRSQQLRDSEKINLIENDLSYLKGKLGQSHQGRDEKKEMLKTSGVSGAMTIVMLAIYEFVTKLKS